MTGIGNQSPTIIDGTGYIGCPGTIGVRIKFVATCLRIGGIGTGVPF